MWLSSGAIKASVTASEYERDVEEPVANRASVPVWYEDGWLYDPIRDCRRDQSKTCEFLTMVWATQRNAQRKKTGVELLDRSQPRDVRRLTGRGAESVRESCQQRGHNEPALGPL